MNKYILILAFSISSLFAVEFYSYEEALKMQKKNKKIIMIDVVRTGCHYCEDMDRDVFKDKEMSKWLDERFIAVKINLDNEKLPLGFKVNFTPTFFFLDENKKLLKTIPGSWNIQDFKDLTKGIK
ncbi:thioredoxin family protein [Sulfurimonas sp.]|uniref:thioredoxin family protein n=1 Tax=Sulfurimonas sp. TaxID=2022749 RepID=UPI00356A724B